MADIFKHKIIYKTWDGVKWKRIKNEIGSTVAQQEAEKWRNKNYRVRINPIRDPKDSWHVSYDVWITKSKRKTRKK